ncbi:TPA: hypothetical protein ACH3X2_010890 [Trebouxia sp. C0005]
MDDAPAAEKAEDMLPHAAGLDIGPSIRQPAAAAHISTAREREEHGLSQDVSHVLTDLVRSLQQKAQFAEPPVAEAAVASLQSCAHLTLGISAR